MKWFMYYLLIANLVTWILYGVDKRKAIKGAWRIPEKTLILSAVIGGSVGALAGMMMFRHKIRKAKFMVGVPVIFVVQCIVLAFVVYG
nr:DUF1294 domain-containing protein [uncultured Mediterraneibacter sp.]